LAHLHLQTPLVPDIEAKRAGKSPLIAAGRYELSYHFISCFDEEVSYLEPMEYNNQETTFTLEEREKYGNTSTQIGL
jgi:hypothetical protein